MSRFKLNRRVFLKGVGGTAIALPMLEAMLDDHGEAHAGGGSSIPFRYIVCLAGSSLGADRDSTHDMFVPNATGANYDLKLALEPLADYDNVKNQVSVVSGLYIPAKDNLNCNTQPPKAGRHASFHVSNLSPLVSGVRSSNGGDDCSGRVVRGETSDQVVAKAIAGDTTHRSLQYIGQAGWYLSGGSQPYGRDIMSVRNDGGSLTELPPTVSPLAAWRGLFQNYLPEEADGAEVARRNFLLDQRRSILDLVTTRTARLMSRISRSDQQRMQRHFDEIRDLERRVNAVVGAAGGSCEPPADPGLDPPYGGDQPQVNGQNVYTQNAGYSDEDTRIRLFCDLMHMAMACDETRVATLCMTMAQSHMNMYQLTGIPLDLHEIGHQRSTLDVSTCIRWHVQHYAYLVAKFRDTPEGAGTMLDRTPIVLLTEGGHGYDWLDNKYDSSHSTERMACLIAGGRAGGLVPGQHVAVPTSFDGSSRQTSGAHPASVLISAMTAAGVASDPDNPNDDLGEVSGTIPQLFQDPGG